MGKTVYETRKEALAQLAERYNTLSQKVGAIDMKINDIMHFLENEKYDAVVMVKITKQLKDLRKERRTLKVEREQIQALRDVIKSRNLDSFAKKGYTYRTDVLKDLVGIEHGHMWTH